MTYPTKREVATILAEMHRIINSMASCYRNDRPDNQNRAERIEKLEEEADQLAEILWRFPPDYPTLSVRAILEEARND